MKLCPYCGEKNEDASRFCLRCGKQFYASAPVGGFMNTRQTAEQQQTQTEIHGHQYYGNTHMEYTENEKPPIADNLWQRVRTWWNGVSKKKILVFSGIILAALGIIALMIVFGVRYAYMHGTCGKNGDIIKWSCDSDGVLTIYGSGDMEDYDFDQLKEPEWNEIWWVNITEVVIEEGVTSIGREAFYYSSLTSIDIANSVKSIGRKAFAYSLLEEVNIPDGVTEIGDRAFADCHQLESAVISKSVRELGVSVFSQCSSLRQVQLPSGLTDIPDHTLFGCEALQSIKLPEGLEIIGDYAFNGCSSLTELVIPEKVSRIESQAFVGTGLSKITFLGSAPNATDENGKKSLCFLGLTATIYYPRHNTTWHNYPVTNLVGYGSNVTWEGYDYYSYD